MSEQIIMNMVSLVLGIMLFFSFILAPMIFKVLPPDNAGVFIRAIFILLFSEFTNPWTGLRVLSFLSNFYLRFLSRVNFSIIILF